MSSNTCFTWDPDGREVCDAVYGRRLDAPTVDVLRTPLAQGLLARARRLAAKCVGNVQGGLQHHVTFDVCRLFDNF